MIGVLTEPEIEELLKEQLVGRLGCQSQGKPYIVPISYAYEGNCIYALSFEGAKLEMMRKNPSVCFQVDVMKDMANWKSVIAWGNFEELHDAESRRKGIGVLVGRSLPLISSVTTHLNPTWPFVETDLNKIEGVAFRIVLTEKTGRFENNHHAVNSVRPGRIGDSTH